MIENRRKQKSLIVRRGNRRRRARRGGAAFAAACLVALAFSLLTVRVAAQNPAKESRPAPRGQEAARLVGEGIAALERGDEAGAKATFERALAAEPDNAAAHTYLGALADRAGDLRRAEIHFAAAVHAAPALAYTRNNYGALLVKLGRNHDAAAQFKESLKLDANQPSALVNLAQLRFAGGKAEDLRAARELFGRAQALAPNAEIARALVVVALRLGDAAGARRHYQDYAARLKESAKEAPAATRAELGAALLENGLVDEAISEMGAAVAADNANVSAVVALGRAHLKRRDIPAAGRTLEAAIARGLDAAPIYAALADVYEAGGYVERAIPAMRLAIARDPKNDLYHARYGMLLTDTKAPAAAIIRLRESLREFPESPRLWLALGIAQLQVETKENPIEALERSLALEPNSVITLAYLGAAHVDRGEYAKAIETFERAIALDATVALPYYLAADAMLKLQSHDEARTEKYLLRAIELDPEMSAAYVELGRFYSRGPRLEEAARHLERAAALAPDLAEAYYHLGRVYTRLKRKEDAQKALANFERLKATQDRRVVRNELMRRLANVRF